MPIALGLCLLVPACGGAGGVRLAQPSGRITYLGEPIRRALVYFAPIGEGLAASAEIRDGVFYALTTQTLDDGIRAGKYRISVLAYPEAPVPNASPENALGSRIESVVTTSGKAIPKRYCDVATSPLEVDILPGTRSLIFDLKD
ncbi:MAG: hypothetical protein U0794_10705 [Isosphaeraceae bacterium]